MATCWEMSTLPAGYIPQRKVTLESSRGSLGFIVCVKSCRMVDSAPRWQLSLCQYSQTICRSQIGWYRLWGETFSWQDPIHSWKAGPGCGKQTEVFCNIEEPRTFELKDWNFARMRFCIKYCAKWQARQGYNLIVSIFHLIFIWASCV